MSKGYDFILQLLSPLRHSELLKHNLHSSQDVVKPDAGHVQVEKYISENFSNWASFRPQYMIGSGNNKDCEEWFFDRK